MGIRALNELPLKDQTVLVRVDFNVPLDDKGDIVDSTRIEAVLPTLHYLLKENTKIILISHLGKPKGKKDLKYSLRPCATKLSHILDKPILFAEDPLSEKTKQQITSLEPQEIILLENLRFYPAEENPTADSSFTETLASYANFYINDAFGTAHRKHASTYYLPSYFKGKAAIGLLMQKEINALSSLYHHPKSPFHVILGGAKISSKIGILQSLLPKAQTFYVGGAMAFTFLAALGLSVGDSIYEESQLDVAKAILQECQNKKIPLLLPTDLIISNNSTHITIDVEQGIKNGWQGVDIGPKTCALWQERLKEAKSVFWNGPLGLFENPEFAKGTFTIAEFLSNLSADTIVGGGDSVAAIDQLHLANKFTHISTGGGASLEFLEKGTLPGIDAIG